MNISSAHHSYTMLSVFQYLFIIEIHLINFYKNYLPKISGSELKLERDRTIIFDIIVQKDHRFQRKHL